MDALTESGARHQVPGVQPDAGGSLANPTAPRPEADLPRPFYGELDPGAGGCLGGGGGGSDPPPPKKLVDRYHFRDHLGSLRIETGEGGWLDLGFDYYPFGLPMESDYATSLNESRRKYTGHERDAETGQDYMMARYKGIQLAEFMTPDPLITGRGSDSTEWNRYAYVRGNPLLLTDPTGMREKLTTEECEDKGGTTNEEGLCIDGGGKVIGEIVGFISVEVTASPVPVDFIRHLLYSHPAFEGPALVTDAGGSSIQPIVGYHGDGETDTAKMPSLCGGLPNPDGWLVSPALADLQNSAVRWEGRTEAATISAAFWVAGYGVGLRVAKDVADGIGAATTISGGVASFDLGRVLLSFQLQSGDEIQHTRQGNETVFTNSGAMLSRPINPETRVFRCQGRKGVEVHDGAVFGTPH